MHLFILTETVLFTSHQALTEQTDSHSRSTCRDLEMLQKVMVHGSEMKYGTYRSCPEKSSAILLFAQAHVRKCTLHTNTRAIAKNDIAAKKFGIFEKRSGIASGKRSECISTQHCF